MTLGIRAANPIWFFNDLVGQPLNDEYYISFLTNDFPYLPQPVFQDVNLTIPWANPLEFGPNGGLPDNIYWNPDLVWRLEIRHGPTQSDALIYEINNFSPGQGIPTPETLDISAATNQITNPQFFDIFFTNNLTISTAGTYDIAPGWQLILTGGPGTTILTQLDIRGIDAALVTGDPPYALKINNSGWTRAILRQRFNHNGAIWSNGAISANLLARSEDGNSHLITVSYNPSAGATNQTIVSKVVTNANFQEVKAALNVNTSMNTDLSAVAFIDIDIELPATGVVSITNVQIVGQTLPLDVSPLPLDQVPTYNQETIERGLDHEFNVFKVQLITRPKYNILSGWNFALNPYQFITPISSTVVPLTSYIADQTILHQETASSLKTGRGGNNINFGMGITAINGVNANRFALIQYIDPSTILPYWGCILSSFVRAALFAPHGTTLRLKARLIYRASLPPTLSNVEPITGWDVNGDVTFAAGWTAVKPLNDPPYVITAPPDPSLGAFTFPGYSYNQFALPQSPLSTINTATVGIVLYSMDPMKNVLGTEDIFVFDSVSLVPNLFAVEANPQTADEVLRECQYYYEKSYNVVDLPGTITNAGVLAYVAPTTYTQQFGMDSPFNTPKRATPATVSWYSPATGTINNIRNNTTAADAPVASSADFSSIRTGYPVLGGAPAALDILTGHWVCDTRLGI